MTGLECIALVIFLESRGEPLEGQQAVASVVWNRTEDPRFPDDPCAVIHQRNQFPKSRFDKIIGDSREYSRIKAFIPIAAMTKHYRTTKALYFRRYDARIDFKNKRFIKQIGNHKFYGH